MVAFIRGSDPRMPKGILVRGTFTPSSEAASLTRAPHLHRNSTPVTVRFSDFAGIPTIADNDPQGAGPRGFAVRFHLADHVHTDIIGHSVNSFPVRSAEGLVEFLNAVIATDPAAPHPNAIEQFLGAHPAAMRFVQIPKPIPTSFARESFFAVSAFKFTTAEGMSRYGRYRVLPVAGNEYLGETEAAARGPNFLFDEIRERVARGPVRFRVAVQLADEATRLTMPRWAGPRSVLSARLAKSVCRRSPRIAPASSNTSSLIRSREWTASKPRPINSSRREPTSI
jgi:catalase